MRQKEKGGEREGETEGAGYPFHTHLNQQRDSVASRRRKWQLAESGVEVHSGRVISDSPVSVNRNAATQASRKKCKQKRRNKNAAVIWILW